MSQRDTADADLPLPLATRHDAAVQGHWLTARLGKRVLRPGGAELAHEPLAITDLANRADVEKLLRRFYGQVFADDILAEPFTELRARGLESHLAVMCDFWDTVLFRAGLYHGNAMVVHRQLDDRHPLCVNHFVRWLQLWNATVDEMYQGPVAERAKIQAARIAKSIHRRLRGGDASQLDVSSVASSHCSPHMHPQSAVGIENASGVIDNVAMWRSKELRP